MNNTLIDNSCEQLQMATLLRQCITNGQTSAIRIATGYWDLAGTQTIATELKTFLAKDKNHRLQLLIGTDPVIRKSMIQTESGKRFPEDFVLQDFNEYAVREEYAEAVQLLLDYCHEEEAASQIQVRIYRKNAEGDAEFLHAKCYIFTGEDIENYAIGIIGSSNLTGRGLTDNSELNYLETNAMTVNYHGQTRKGHIQWFDALWDIATPWNQIFVVEGLNKIKSYIPTKPKTTEIESLASLTPYEVYIKYLQDQFGNMADHTIDEQLKGYLPHSYQPYQFQLDAVKQCFFIMRNHYGFILADVVGLGKTVVGTLLIKHFLNMAMSLHRSKKVLVLAPPSILAGWQKTIRDFDKDAADKLSSYVTLLSTGKMDDVINPTDIDVLDEIDTDDADISLDYKEYGLILIDESHNFRNSETRKYKKLDNLIGELQGRGIMPYIGLLSATPQNNGPRDLKNQIYLFQRNHNNSTLRRADKGKLDSFFSRQEKVFNAHRLNLASPDPILRQEAREAIKQMSREIRECVLDEITVRRTRTDITKSKLYAEDAAHIHFPKVEAPERLDYKMNHRLCQLYADTVNSIWQLQPYEDTMVENPSTYIGFFRYCGILFLKDKSKYKRGSLTVETISRRLKKIEQILLIKRLESSFSAFKESLTNLQHYTQNMIEMWQHNIIYICPDIDVNALFRKANYQFDEAVALIEKQRQKNPAKAGYCLTRENFTEVLIPALGKTMTYIEALEHDKHIIDNLCERWGLNSSDPKLDTFKDIIRPTLFNPEKNNPHGYDEPRLVIFTEAIATQKVLAEALEDKGYKVLAISAANRNAMQDTIRANFDANYEGEQRDDYEVIVTTEVLAEGVNLHRSNVILNYDAPWNATRLMQRIGRVNRIGSKEDQVHVFNFYPTPESDEQINLLSIVQAKLQAFHTMFGEDNQIFSAEEELPDTGFDLNNEELSVFLTHQEALVAFKQQYPQRYEAILNTPWQGQGGAICNRSTGISTQLAIVAAENRLPLGIRKQNTLAEEMDTLTTLNTFRCDENAIFAEVEETEQQAWAAEAIEAYKANVLQTTTHLDDTPVLTEAKGILNTVKKYLVTPEGRAAWKKADTALRYGNIHLARKIRERKEAFLHPNLLNDQNLDMFISTYFGQIDNDIHDKVGEIKLLTYQFQ